jgi:hypothetical protein
MHHRMNKEAQLALESLLSGLNRDQLQSLLLKLAEHEPSLIATMEKQVALLCSSSSQPTTPSPLTPVLATWRICSRIREETSMRKTLLSPIWCEDGKGNQLVTPSASRFLGTDMPSSQDRGIVSLPVPFPCRLHMKQVARKIHVRGFFSDF